MFYIITIGFFLLTLIGIIYFLKQKRVPHGAQVREYGYEINKFNLTNYGECSYAQWLHPSETKKELTDSYIKQLSPYISEGDFVIDVGAHSGDTTVPYALLTGKSGATLALEPNPYVYKVLEKNAQLNQGKVNIFPENIAATEKDGDFTFLYSDDGFCNGGNLDVIANKKHHHRYELKVKGKNLSNLLRTKYKDQLGKLSFIKTDTEGYDKDVLESISDILKEFKPVVVAEVLKKLDNGERLELLKFIQSLGYETYKTDAVALEKEDKLTADNLMNWNQYDILCIPEAQT